MNLSHKEVKKQHEQGLYKPYKDWESFFDVIESMHHQYDGFESIFGMLRYGFKKFIRRTEKDIVVARNRELLKFLDAFATDSCLDKNAYPGSFSSTSSTVLPLCFPKEKAG